MVMESESAAKSSPTLKFLCSYGGKIVPRHSSGQLRYSGGHTRVLSVDRSISFAELMVKLGEFCGYSVELKCQLPNGDLETLVSVRSEEELANLVELYEASFRNRDWKIRAVLSPPKSLKTVSPPPSKPSSPAAYSPYSSGGDCSCRHCHSPPAGVFRDCGNSNSNKVRYYPAGQGQKGNSPRFLCRDPHCYRNWH